MIQVGDFISRGGEIVRVTQVREDQDPIVCKREGRGSYVCSSYEGIRIKDYLKELKYNKQNFKFDLFDDIELRYASQTFTLHATCLDRTNVIGYNQCLMCVQYVHELQQVVRLISGREIDLDL